MILSFPPFFLFPRISEEVDLNFVAKGNSFPTMRSFSNHPSVEKELVAPPTPHVSLMGSRTDWCHLFSFLLLFCPNYALDQPLHHLSLSPIHPSTYSQPQHCMYFECKSSEKNSSISFYYNLSRKRVSIPWLISIVTRERERGREAIGILARLSRKGGICVGKEKTGRRDGETMRGLRTRRVEAHRLSLHSLVGERVVFHRRHPYDTRARINRAEHSTNAVTIRFSLFSIISSSFASLLILNHRLRNPYRQPVTRFRDKETIDRLRRG